MCNVRALITNGLLLGEDGEVAEELLTSEFVSILLFNVLIDKHGVL